MIKKPISPFYAPISARGFDNLPEATATVLDVLEMQLSDCAVFVALSDSISHTIRIGELRGSRTFGLARGDELPLGAANGNTEQNQAQLAQVLLTNPERSDIKSFVGIPLELSNGQGIGTLCAISNATARFSHNDVELLTVMGRVIVNEQERHNTQLDLKYRHDVLVRHNARLRVDAATDPLTGVGNRRSFETSLSHEWKLSRRGTVQSYLVIIDLDDFKAVNDQYGHPAGDTVIKTVAEALADAGRDTDCVGRLGGDEFGVILVGCDGGEHVATYRERARALINQRLSEGPAQIRFSAGYQSLADASSPERALELADQAMYWHKRQHSERITSATPKRSLKSVAKNDQDR